MEINLEAGIEAALQALYLKERARLSAQTALKSAMHGAPLFGEGNAHPKLMLVGEAPGAEEIKLNRPFVGKAGKQLDALLHIADIRREDIYITNAVKYRPVTLTKTGMRNRTPTKKEVEASLYILKGEIAHLSPRIIATLGNTPLLAVRMLCGLTGGTIGALHGQAWPIALSAQCVTLYPMYHPASTIYNRALLPICEADAKCLGKLVNNR